MVDNLVMVDVELEQIEAELIEVVGLVVSLDTTLE